MSHKVFTAEDGEKVLIGYFRNFRAIEEWDVTPSTNTPKTAAERCLLEYDVVVAEVVEHHAMNFTGMKMQPPPPSEPLSPAEQDQHPCDQSQTDHHPVW